MKPDDATIEAWDRERSRIVAQIALRRSYIRGFVSGTITVAALWIAWASLSAGVVNK